MSRTQPYNCHYILIWSKKTLEYTVIFMSHGWSNLTLFKLKTQTSKIFINIKFNWEDPKINNNPNP